MKSLFKLLLQLAYARRVGITSSWFVVDTDAHDPILTLRLDWPGGGWQVGRFLSQWRDSISYVSEEVQRCIEEQETELCARYNENLARAETERAKRLDVYAAFERRQLALFSPVGVGSETECPLEPRNEPNEPQNEPQNEQPTDN